MKKRLPDPMLPPTWTGWGTPPADGKPTADSLDIEPTENVDEIVRRHGKDECSRLVPELDAARLDLARRLTAAISATPPNPARIARLAYRLGVVSMQRSAARIHADISSPARTDVEIIVNALNAWRDFYGHPLKGEKRQWEHVNAALKAAGKKGFASPRSWAKWKSVHRFGRSEDDGEIPRADPLPEDA